MRDNSKMFLAMTYAVTGLSLDSFLPKPKPEKVVEEEKMAKAEAKRLRKAQKKGNI